MYRLRSNEVSALEIAQFLNTDLLGENLTVSMPSTIEGLLDASVVFIESVDAGGLEALRGGRHVLVISPREFAIPGVAVVVTPKPKLAFARVVNEFFIERELASVHPTAIVAEPAGLGTNVTVGPYSVIGPDVQIGDETEVRVGAVISGVVKIGRRCLIKDRATIGSEGYGFVEDEQGRPVPVPQCGRILIGDDAWIGSNSTIERAAFADTVIGDSVKIDDLVHVGNGTRIGKRSMVTAGVVLSQSVTVGEDCWLMPNVTVRGEVKIADGVTVGVGSTVIEDLCESGVYVGSPAHLLRRDQ